MTRTSTPPRPPELERLLAEEPFVRSLARTLLADEADDVVQQTWLRALESRTSAGAVQRPRQWLAQIVRNLVTDRRRRNQRRAARERAAASSRHVPSSAELLEGEEVRRALVLAVDNLPTPLRTVVLLRYYDGLPPRAIAAQLQLPITTVWNRLHAGIAALRRRLDQRMNGDRRAWALPLVPFAASPRSLPFREALNSTTTLGVLAMTTKAKILTAAAIALALCVAWAAWPGDERPVPADRETAGADAADPATGGLGARGSEPAAISSDRVAPATPPAVPASATGTLVVTVRYDAEPHLAGGLTVLVFPQGGDARIAGRRATTDAEGNARFESLPPGKVRARSTVLPDASTSAEITAGATTECTLTLAEGMKLSGLVTDGAGIPIAGAVIETVMAAVSGVDAEPVAITAADGTFELRECTPLVLVGARAAGYAASPLHFFYGESGQSRHVHIELRHAGGSVIGTVVDGDGEPVKGAVVRVGEGKTQGVQATPQGAKPLPAQVHTDSKGSFTAIGVPPGSQPLLVRSPAHAPWVGECQVLAGCTSQVVVVLQAGATCRGIVRTETGAPAAASVRVGEGSDFTAHHTQTNRDGTFVLTGLTPGEFEVRADRQRLGKASASLFGIAGQTVECELALSNGIALRGTVVDDNGAAIVQAGLRCSTDPAIGGADRWHEATFSDPNGEFLVPDCPPGSLLSVEVQADGFVTRTLTDVDPLAAELQIRLERDDAPRGEIRGRLLRPDGRGATGVTIEAFCYEPQRYDAKRVKAADGTFVFDVQPGRWALRIRDEEHPEVTVGPRDMGPAEVWDVGTLEQVRGGTVVVTNNTGAEAKPSYRIVSDDEQFSVALFTPVPPMRSQLLSPGRYHLLVHGDGCAAQSIPFLIRAEQETGLDVRTTRGVRQSVAFVIAGTDELPFSIDFDIRRGTELVVRHWARDRNDRELRAEVWLPPGNYTIATRNRDAVAGASFSVGATEGKPVQVELR